MKKAIRWMTKCWQTARTYGLINQKENIWFVNAEKDTEHQKMGNGSLKIPENERLDKFQKYWTAGLQGRQKTAMWIPEQSNREVKILFHVHPVNKARKGKSPEANIA